MDPQEMKPVRMSDYEKYLLQQQAEQSPRHNDMTIDERMTEYIEWQNTDFDRDLMVDAHLEIVKLRRRRDGLTAELAAAREERDSIAAGIRTGTKHLRDQLAVANGILHTIANSLRGDDFGGSDLWAHVDKDTEVEIMKFLSGT